jgi:hypothetical protein
MNEMKPEDVMKALDILDKMNFFQGQRAGRELWFEKPFEVQEQDIADFSQGIAFLKNLIEDALALLREKDARIKHLEKTMKESILSNTELLENLNRLVEKKDAEIKYHRKTIAQNAQLALEVTIDEIQKARAEAITEFAERVKTFYRNLRGKTIGGSVEYHIEQIAKEMKGENNNDH